MSLDGRVSLDHRVYRVAAEVIGERVEVWKGVFDLGIYVQDKAGTIYNPFEPESGTIPFGTYHRWRKTECDTRVEKIEQMASGLSIPAHD